MIFFTILFSLQSFASNLFLKDLELLPIQNQGRIKPFCVVAQEWVLEITGKRQYRNYEPTELVLSWIAHSEYWKSQEIFWVPASIQKDLGEVKKLYSLDFLLGNDFLKSQIHKIDFQKKNLTAFESSIKEILARLSLYQKIVAAELLMILPTTSAWLGVDTKEMFGDYRDTIRLEFLNLINRYLSQDSIGFELQAQRLRISVESLVPSFFLIQNQLKAEWFLIKYRPFFYAWVFYLLAAIAGLLPFLVRKKKYWMSGLTGIGILCHLCGIFLRCYIAGRPPVTNMYESVIWVSIGVIFFGVGLVLLKRCWIALTCANALSVLFLIAADLSPSVLNPAIHPLVPVLRSNYWLTVHVLTITLSYAAFALSFGISTITCIRFFQTSALGAIQALNDLTYRCIQVGVVLIAAGTILGGVWADQSWGRFWGWDPKEVWALITLLVYVGILHGRYTNWMGPFMFAFSANVAFLAVIMAWYGVNFILGFGLHSYGFSSGGGKPLMIFVSLQAVFLGVMVWRSSIGKRLKKN